MYRNCLEMYSKLLRALLLTSPRQDITDCSVTNCSITGFNVHERLATHSHEHPLLNTKLWNIVHFINFNLSAAKC